MSSGFVGKERRTRFKSLGVLKQMPRRRCKVSATTSNPAINELLSRQAPTVTWKAPAVYGGRPGKGFTDIGRAQGMSTATDATV